MPILHYTGWPDPLPKGRMWMDALFSRNGRSAKLFIKFHCETQAEAPDEGTMTFACDDASAFILQKRFGRMNLGIRLSTLRRWCDELSIEPIESRWSS